MKKIVLAPIKNEAWILEIFLANNSWADLVILADQYSIDDTVAIVARFPNVRLIKNDLVGHSNKIRWALLEEARKAFGDDDATSKSAGEAGLDKEVKLIFCLDADEIITREALDWTINIAETEITEALSAGQTPQALRFAYPWIQLFNSPKEYRIDSVWKGSKKTMAFLDHPDLTYPNTEVLNDHTERIPDANILTPTTETSTSTTPAITAKNLECPHPVLHLQFLAKRRSLIKQAWYMCQELLKSGRNPKEINLQYSPALQAGKIETLTTQESWLVGLQFPSQDIFNAPDAVKLEEIKKIFAKQNNSQANSSALPGISKFEPLDIWDNPELAELFIKEIGRKPVVSRYPFPMIVLFRMLPKSFKNMIKSVVWKKI